MKLLKQQTLAWLLAGAIGLTVSSAMLSAQETKSGATSPTTTGSGNRYKTTISQETKGELKPDDARQISVLGSRILTHVHNALRFFGEENADQARTELEHAQNLARVVREMLPVTVVWTTTTDAQGKEVYRYEDRVQQDQIIPIVEGLINVAVVQPIVEAKKEQASVKGLQLADADLIYTAVLLNLDYVESKIRQALAKLKEPDKARSELMAAASIGVRFTRHREDHPLVNIQAALRLAEQQVREGKPEGAKANLELARVQLDAYRTLVGETVAKGAGDLEKEIAALQDKTGEPGAADKIRGFWNRVTEWFTPERGRAQQTTGRAE